MRYLLALFALSCSSLVADNQTPTLSTVTVNGKLPFDVTIELADFQLPAGLQSYVYAVHDGKWLILCGRINGLHGFGPSNNFPADQQNTTAYVVNPKKGKVYSRSLLASNSGLSQAQVDSLSVTAAQFYKKGKTLYITGGYGIDTASSTFTTKDILTAIDVPGMMHWVQSPSHHETARQHIRQITNPIFQVTGGDMYRVKNHPTLLVFGQDFEGEYTDSSDGTYIEQVRRFRIHNGKKLRVHTLSSLPSTQDPNYRRRDLNIVPIVYKRDGKVRQKLVAYAGVFTPTTGVWTVPVDIKSWGKPHMEDPANPNTFKQAMNQYTCAHAGLFSEKHNNMYSVLLGGISYGYFQNGTFQTDSEIPFINQVTTIKRDKHGNYSQYLMPNQYPVILSTQSNPGNQLLFGASAEFIVKDGVPCYSNGVIKLDSIKEKKKVIGYIVGGIQSTLSNTNVPSDSAASPYIFKVVLQRN